MLHHHRHHLIIGELFLLQSLRKLYSVIIIFVNKSNLSKSNEVSFNVRMDKLIFKQSIIFQLVETFYKLFPNSFFIIYIINEALILCPSCSICVFTYVIYIRNHVLCVTYAISCTHKQIHAQFEWI